jgi:hypothetical protein
MVLGCDFQLPVDAAGFSPRECPRCRVGFKTRWSRRDAGVLAAALVGRLQHLNPAEADLGGSLRHCPYCGSTAPPAQWWTAELRQWFEAQARDLDQELRWRRLRVPLAGLGENPRPTHLTVPPRPDAPPIVRTDDEELVRVPLPCCGEECQVSDGWIGPVRCHFCGFVHARATQRDIGLELAQLTSWSGSR